MTEKTGTPAPAAEPSEPAVAPPSQRTDVDLSDLQAEVDSKRSQADEDEINDDIARTGKDDDGDDESDEDESADDEDGADEGADDEEKDEDADAEEDSSAKAQGRKKSRAARYRDQISRLEQDRKSVV